MRISKFEEIESWKEARRLTSTIYAQTSKPKFSKDYGLRDQIQRTSVSIMANIAEGFDAGSIKGFVNFLNFAYRSAWEVQLSLYAALDQKYLEEADFETIYDDAAVIKKLVGGLIKYLKTNQEARTEEQELGTKN